MKSAMLSVVGVVSLAAAAGAADRTWNGGGADVGWSTAANWGGAAPVAGDTLFFGGSSRLTNTNDFDADTAFAGLTFNSGAGAFALGGNGLTLGGNVTNFDNDVQTINLPMILSATRVFSATSGALAINGALSGAGGLTKTGSQPVTLSASNSYAGATTVKAGGTLRITHANALGTTNGTTVVEDGGWVEMSGGINVAESFALYGDASIGYAGVLRSTGGSNILSGPVTSATRIKCTSGSLDIIGGVGGGGLILGAEGTAYIRFSEKPIRIGGGTIYAHTGSLLIFAVTNNAWGNVEISGNYLRTDVEGALPNTSTLTLGSSTLSGLNLNGNNQTIGQLVCTTATAGTRTIYSATPATLTVNQSATTTFAGTFTGAARLVKAGTGTLTFTNSVSATTGDVIVSNGTLVVESGAGFSFSTNVVVAAGTLELRNANALSDNATLSIASSGAKVKVGAGVTETLNVLVLGGVVQGRGTYGSSASGAVFTNDAFFSGIGQLAVRNVSPVTAVDATWDAGGGSDTLVSTAANWQDDALPAFDGTTRAIFATGGGTATVDRAVGLYGIMFNSNATFTVAAGAGVISNGAGGILASAPVTATRTYTLAENLVLTDNQTWCVTTNTAGATTLNVTGSIDDESVPCALTKTEFGQLTLSASNTFDGAVMVSNGILRVTHSNALGSTNGNTTVLGYNGGLFYLNGNLNLAEPLALNGERNNGGTLFVESGSNTLSGPVTLYNQVRLVVYTGALVVSGGLFAGDSNGSLVLNSGTMTRFHTKPLSLGTRTFYSDSGGIVILDVAGNVWSDTLVASGTLRCDVPNALPATASLRLGVGYGPGGTLDLNGNSQTLGKLYLNITNAAVRTVTSPAPALLTVNQSENTLFDARFTGAVSLLKLGSGTLTLTNAFSTTSGGFNVSSGTLAVAVAGTFGPNCTNVVVSGAGTLALSNSVAIADSAVVTMPAIGVSTAKIHLGTGVNETVGRLVFGAKMMRAGTYGSNSGSAYFKDSTHFSGTGMLTVRYDNSGTLIRVQ